MEQLRQPEQSFAPPPVQSAVPDSAAPDTTAYDRTPLTIKCDYGRDGKLQRKTERFDGNTDEYAYAFDNKGRLTDVRLNGHPLESYRYNASGQRILQVCLHGGLRQNERQYRYNGNGALARAGRAEFYYDRNGALSQRCDDNNTIFFEYGSGSRLDKVHRRDGWEIRYEYGPLSPQPIRRFKHGRLTHEYVWQDPTRLSVCRDHYNGIEYQFSYGADGKLDRLRLVNLLHIDPRASGGMWGNPLPAGSAEDKARLKAARLDHFYESMARNNRKSPRSLFDESYAPREFLCCTDQVGTLRALVAMNGAVIKEIKRDSFGIPYHDSFPDFHLPIGFAGGLTDPDTGLVRFGWRDYDPTIGRFTALDPAKDRRGDGDLYDYCMDDPVSRVDPTGLWSKENFDESKVNRDNLGQFASTPGGGAGGGAGGGNPANGVNNASAPQPDSAILVADAGGTATDAPGWLVAANSGKKSGQAGAAKSQAYTLDQVERNMGRIGRINQDSVPGLLDRGIALNPDDPRLSPEQRETAAFLKTTLPEVKTFLFPPSGEFADKDPRRLWERIKALAPTDPAQRKAFLDRAHKLYFTEANMLDWLEQNRKTQAVAYHTGGIGLASDPDFAFGNYSQDQVFAKVDGVMQRHDASNDSPSPQSRNTYKTAPGQEKILGDVKVEHRERDRARTPMLEAGAAAYAGGRAKTPEGRAEIDGFLAERNAPYIAEHWTNPQLANTRSKITPPQQYAEYAEAEARRLNLPVRMSVAMMVVESDGDPKAMSPAGARGLMQVTPITMKELAEYDPKRFGKYVTVVNGQKRVNMDALSDPKTGIEAGMAALKMYMDRFNGDPEKALIAYNWGPANVGKKEADLTETQKIGYNRAQTYVKDIRRVLRTTDGSKPSDSAPDQSEEDKYAPLPQKSLLHYLKPEEVKKYSGSR